MGSRVGVALGALAAVVMAVVVVGCGVDPKRIDASEARIKALSDKGAPDSALFRAKVLISEVRTMIKTNSVDAAKGADSLDAMVLKAEQWYDEALKTAGVEVNLVTKDMLEKKAGLSGLQLAAADALLATAEQEVAQNKMIQARATLAKLEQAMPALLEDEQKAATFKVKVIGTWKQSIQPDGIGTTSVLKTTFTFKKDGSFESAEEKKGQSDDNTKEDWKFLASGTWQMKGDTVMMHVTREKCERQNYEFRRMKEGREYWEKKQEPTYDSTFTDNHKDKTLAWKDLTADFKK